jgi:ATP-dependent RNA helicase HelY
LPATPQELIDEFTASLPYQLDPFQVEAIEALANRHSVLVAAPTGTGKTVVGEFGIFMARTYGTRAIYTTPIKALSNQKFRDFRHR